MFVTNFAHNKEVTSRTPVVDVCSSEYEYGVDETKIKLIFILYLFIHMIKE